MSAPTIHEFIRELDASRTHYVLSSAREGAVMMQVTLPGERWEIEFFDDREPEVEIFRSNGDMFGPEKLTELRYGEALGSAFDPFQKFGLRPAPEIWFCVQSERAGPPWPGPF